MRAVSSIVCWFSAIINAAVIYFLGKDYLENWVGGIVIAYSLFSLFILIIREASVAGGNKIEAGIFTIIFVSVLGGILTLCIPKKELMGENANADSYSAKSKGKNVAQNIHSDQTFQEDEQLFELLEKYEDLLKRGDITQEVYDAKRKKIIGAIGKSAKKQDKTEKTTVKSKKTRQIEEVEPENNLDNYEYEQREYGIVITGLKNNGLTHLFIPKIAIEIGESAFEGNQTITSVTVCGNVKKIGSCAFRCCENLKKVIVGDDVVIIEEGAFMCCSALEDLELGYSLLEIGDSAFNACECLNKVVIPDATERIGEFAFCNCSPIQIECKRALLNRISHQWYDDDATVHER